jgi:hypothetical protein
VPVINPYEHYRFNVGASSPRKRTTATEKRAGGLAGRRAILAAAEKKAKEKAKDTEMTDFDLIKENMGDAAGKVSTTPISSVVDIHVGLAFQRRRVEASQTEEVDVVEAVPAKRRPDNAPSQASKPGSTHASAATEASRLIAAPTRSHFSFGVPEQDTTSTTESTASAPTSAFNFSKPVPTAPSPYERKNDALDIVMATAGASTSPAAKLTPAVFSVAPSREVAVPERVSPTKEHQKDVVNRPAREEALTIASGALPVFVFKCLANLPSLATGVSFAATQKARSVPSIDLPKFDFDHIPSDQPPSKTSMSLPNSVAAATTSSSQAAATSTPPTGFTGWGAIAKPSTSGATWTCNSCFLQSKVSSTECDVCEAPRPVVAPAKTASPVQAPPRVAPAAIGFTGWGANFGTAPAAKSGSDQDWTCSLCGCKSKATSQQCDVCETKRS